MERILFLERLANLTANRLDMTQVELAIPQAGRPDAKKGDFGFHHRRFSIGGGVEVTGAVTFGNHFADARFDNRAATAVHGCDLCRIQVHPGNGIALVCQAGGRHRPDISQPKNADRLHAKLWFPEYLDKWRLTTLGATGMPKR